MMAITPSLCLMLKTELRQAGCRDPAVIIVHHPWSCAERIPDIFRWDSLYPIANQLYGCVFSCCFSSMNSTQDTRNSGSGHYVENLYNAFLGGKKKGKKKSARKVSIRTEAAKGCLRRLRLPCFNPRNYAPYSHSPPPRPPNPQCDREENQGIKAKTIS